MISQSEAANVVTVTPVILWAAAGVMLVAMGMFASFAVFAIRSIVREVTTRELGSLNTNIAVLNETLKNVNQSSEKLGEEVTAATKEMGYVRRDVAGVKERVAHLEGAQQSERRGLGRRTSDTTGG